MQRLFVFLLLVPQFAFALDCSELKVPTSLAKWWRDGDIYFRPAKTIVSPVWIGTVYIHDSKMCCSLKETEDSFSSKKVKCPASLKKLAAVKPLHIQDFRAFKSKFSVCLAAKDRACLKSLMAFQVRTGFGFDVYGDLREQAIQKWGASGLTRMKNLLDKGIVGSGDHRSFPPKPDKKGLGWRGTFVHEKEGWVLESFLTGQ